MIKVVVGFDFSSGSAKAVDLAIDIAKHWHSDIRLVYVKEKDEDENAVRDEIERRNAAVADKLDDIAIDYVLRQGNPAAELSAQAAADNAAILVVGTHGMSGMKTNMLGRNSYKTIESSSVPVLIVREDFDFNKSLETIVVPIDSSDDTRQKVAAASLFARTFNSTLHILGLYTASSDDLRRRVDNYLFSVQRHLDASGVQYLTKKVSDVKNVTTATLNYASSVQADMIAIMTEQEYAPGSLLLGNYAQQMINLSKIPVLTVRPRPVLTENANY